MQATDGQFENLSMSIPSMKTIKDEINTRIFHNKTHSDSVKSNYIALVKRI